MDLDYDDGLELIKKCYEQTSEEFLHKQWLVDYSKMTKENFISFKDYVDKMKAPVVNMSVSQEDVVIRALEIERKVKESLNEKRGD